MTETPPANGNGHAPRFNPDEPGVRNAFEHQLSSVVMNAFSNRMDYFNKLLDPRRDLDRECGYPSTYSVGPDLYRQLYDRDPIANRVVQLMPKECWQKTPKIYEDESAKNVTEFEQAWDDLSKQLSPERSWYQDEEGSLVWEYLRRADEISGIGAFGVILLGLDDGKDLREPVEGAVSDKYVRDRKGKKKTTTNGTPRLDPAKLSFPTPLPDDTVLDEMVANSATPPPKEWTENGSVMNKHVDQTAANKYSVDPRFVRNAEGYTQLELVRNGSIVTNEIKTGAQVVAGTEGQYFNQFGSSASGTDAQYVGVQLGASQFPVEEPLKEKLSLTFVRVFDEALVQIVQYEANIRNPRFSRPVMYRITFNDPREQHSGIGLPLASIMVHWTRIVHLVDTGNGVSSEIFAASRMRPVLNPLLDGRKIAGAGAEGYWQSCFASIVLSTHPQLGGEVQLNKEDIKDQVENYMGTLQRWLILSGMGASTLAPTVVDPTPHADMQIQRICIQIGCPKRVFMGSERGELASSQDDSKWNDRVAHRQNTYVTPRVINPFVDRLILLGVLPEPVGYSVEWPDLDSTTKKDKAGIFFQRVQAYAAAITGNVESLFSPLDMMTKLDDMDEEEAQAIIDAATKIHEKDMTMTMPPAGAPGHPATVVPPPKPPTPGPTILGPGQTAIPHPDAAGAKPGAFTAPGKPAPGVQVQAAPVAAPPKPPVGNANPEGCNQYKSCGEAADDLKTISDASLHPDMKAEHVNAAVHGILGGMSKDQLKETGEAFGVRGKAKEITEKVKAKINDRREMFARSNTHGTPHERDDRPGAIKATVMLPKAREIVARHVTGNSNPEGCNQHTGPGCSSGGDKPTPPVPTTKSIKKVFESVGSIEVSTKTGEQTVLSGRLKVGTVKADTRGFKFKQGFFDKNSVDVSWSTGGSYIERIARQSELHMEAVKTVLREQGYHISEYPTNKMNITVSLPKTTNANPEGINQYSHRSALDDAMSKGDVGGVRQVVERLKGEPKHVVREVLESYGYSSAGRGRKEMVGRIKEHGEGVAVSKARTDLIGNVTPNHDDGDGPTGNGSNPTSAIRKAGREIADSGLAMPGYGQIFIKENGSGEVWYVGGDGDDRDMQKLLEEKLLSIEGLDELRYEAEHFPPEDGTWRQVYPEVKTWVENENPEGCNQYVSCGGGGSFAGATKDKVVEMGKALATTASNVKGSLKSTASAVGKKAFDKLPEPIQRAASAAHAVGKAVNSHLESAFKAGQEFAKKVAEERGLNPQQVERVGRMLALADTIARWGPSVPMAGSLISAVAHVGGPVAFGIKTGLKYVPIASLSYSATHPISSIRVARKGIREMMNRRQLAANGLTFNEMGEDESNLLAEAVASHPESDWYEVLLHAALDECQGNVAMAVKFADAYFAENSDGGSDDDEGEDDFGPSEESFDDDDFGGREDEQ